MVKSILQVFMFLVVALAILFAFCPIFAPAACADGGTTLGKHSAKTLHGSVQDCGIFTDELQARLGVGVARVKGKLTIALVMPGKGAQAGLQERDEVLAAGIENDVVSLKVERNGKVFDLRIVLSDGQSLNGAAARLKTRAQALTTPETSGPVQRQAQRTKHASMIVFPAKMAEQLAQLQSAACEDGWTTETIQASNIWAAENKVGVHALPLMRPWLSRTLKAHIFVEDYMTKCWPDDLVGWREYHLSVDRSGEVRKVWLMHHIGHNWCNDEARWEKFARAAIEGISKSRMLACPPTSQVPTFECGVYFSNFHNNEMHY